jgi:serine/threonine protein kinase
MNLRYDSKPSPFVIAYYGSFIDNDTYNIILEFADRGNFEDFMRTTPEPSTGEEMIEFWDYRASPPFGRIYIICVWANPTAPGGLQG